MEKGNGEVGFFLFNGFVVGCGEDQKLRKDWFGMVWYGGFVNCK